MGPQSLGKGHSSTPRAGLGCGGRWSLNPLLAWLTHGWVQALSTAWGRVLLGGSPSAHREPPV